MEFESKAGLTACHPNRQQAPPTTDYLRDIDTTKNAQGARFDMNQTSPADLARDLNEFSRRLEARVYEFKERGEFSSVHDALTNDIRKRQAELSRKVSEAIQRGTTWEVIKTELTRDYKSLYDNFSRWEERLDAKSMKRSKD